MSLPVVEIFDSVQGEGPFIHPAIFLRTALCNLKCRGFCCTVTAPDGSAELGCDTIRAVSLKFKDTWTKYHTSDDLIKALLRCRRVYPLRPSFLQDLIVTGGEPLLHFNNPVLTQSMDYFIRAGHRVTVETNASVDTDYMYDSSLYDLLKGCTFSMSVKLQSSLESAERRIRPRLIDHLFEHSRDSYLKFVVSKESFDTDISEIESILNSVSNRIPVYLMPLARDRKQLEENCTFVLEKCIEYGFNYTDRIHVRAWNTKEGV